MLGSHLWWSSTALSQRSGPPLTWCVNCLPSTTTVVVTLLNGTAALALLIHISTVVASWLGHAQDMAVSVTYLYCCTLQVLDEICQILTDKQFKGKMVVVLAGYEAQVEELLAVNPGLKSRFSERLLFPDFTADDAIQLLKQQLVSEYSMELSDEADKKLPGLMQKVRVFASRHCCYLGWMRPAGQEPSMVSASGHITGAVQRLIYDMCASSHKARVWARLAPLRDILHPEMHAGVIITTVWLSKVGQTSGDAVFLGSEMLITELMCTSFLSTCAGLALSVWPCNVCTAD